MTFTSLGFTGSLNDLREFLMVLREEKGLKVAETFFFFENIIYIVQLPSIEGTNFPLYFSKKSH